MKTTNKKADQRHQILIVALIAALTFPSWFLNGGATASSPSDQEILASFASLQRFVATLPKTLLGAKQRASLDELFKESLAVYTKGDSCGGAKNLAAALNEVQALHKASHNSIVEDLHNRVWTLRQDILNNLPPGKGCEDSPLANRPPKVEIIESDDQHLRGTVTFGEPRMTSVTAEGELFTELDIPGLDNRIGQAGMPGVPLLHRLIGVPSGAKTVLVVKTDQQQARTYKVNLYPVQPEALDSAQKDEKEGNFKEPPFTRNKDVYGRDEAFPDRIGATSHLGRARDLQMAQLTIAAGQYNPVTKALTLFSSVEFEVNFVGGKGAFLDGMSLSPFESMQALYVGAALNNTAISKFIDPIILPRFNCGEEFLILTHPDFRHAADELAVWKNAKGIPTSVVEVNDGAGAGPDTKEEIDAFIEARFNRCGLRPSYLLLLGDAEFIPTFYVATSGSATTGSDYAYALVSGDDEDLMPDFALGRIPVDTQEQAQTVVDKIINYEAHPPAPRSFYENVGIASQFQCCLASGQEGRDQRGFIETSELMRNKLLDHGYAVDRIYTKSLEGDYVGDPIPRRFFNGTLLPDELRASSGFTWDGDAADIANAINDGRFLFMHRDHGSKNGWAHPSFLNANVDALTNGELLPVVFSVNCASALFDNETAGGDYSTLVDGVYFSERLLRKADGGAIGILGDTRDSPTWANNALARGFFDAVWTDTIGDFGSSRSHRRLGDILNHGKLYLATQVGVAGTGIAPIAEDLTSELFLWHVIGDPTLEMWTSRPVRLPWKFDTVRDLRGMRVKYPVDGAILTAFQHTKSGVIPLGRAEVSEEQAKIQFVRTPLVRVPIEVSASFENAVSVKLRQE
ncbi:MAG: C25 family cysteine peptidase [Acidobacteriota bacterium]